MAQILVALMGRYPGLIHVYVAIVIVIGVVCCSLGAGNLQKQYKLESNGVSTSAQVDSWREINSGTIEVGYSFQVAGKKYSNVERLDRNRPDSKGDVIPIRYLPDNPSISHANAYWSNAYAQVSLGILCFVFCGILYLARAYAMRKGRWPPDIHGLYRQ